MSKIGKKPIEIPAGITVTPKEDALEVKGKNGTITVPVLPGVKIEVKDNLITLTANNKIKQTISNWGTTNAHIKNAIAGATEDFSKELSIVGIGFKAAVEGKVLVLNVGFSHQVRFDIPEGIKITVEKSIIKVSGNSRWLVGETAANIRKVRKPEPYQGKGIRYKDEVVRRKAGKKAAAKAGPAK